MNMWMGICSNGVWIAWWTNKTFNYEKFLLFLNHIDDWLKENNCFGYSEVLIIMDNWSIHKTSNVKDEIIKSNIKWIYQPWYTPQWAPVENYFSILKDKLKKRKSKKIINLSLKENFNVIYESMGSISSLIIKNLFKNLMRQLKMK